jgi:hypothetical protein
MDHKAMAHTLPLPVSKPTDAPRSHPAAMTNMKERFLKRAEARSDGFQGLPNEDIAKWKQMVKKKRARDARNARGYMAHKRRKCCHEATRLRAAAKAAQRKADGSKAKAQAVVAKIMDAPGVASHLAAIYKQQVATAMAEAIGDGAQALFAGAAAAEADAKLKVLEEE